MSTQKNFEEGVFELLKKAFTTTITRCRKITSLTKPLDGILDYILVENQMGQSLLVETDDVAEAVNLFHLHYAEQIQDLEIKLFYTKARFNACISEASDRVHYFVEPDLMDELDDGLRRKYYYLPIPLDDVTEPMGDKEPHGRVLRLPLAQNSALAQFSTNTVANAFEPVFDLNLEQQTEPFVCLLVEIATAEDAKLPNSVSLLATRIIDIGAFPVLYGVERYLHDDYCDDKGREQLLNMLKNSPDGETYYLCECCGSSGTKADVINKILRVEQLDYFVPAEDNRAINVCDWNRIDRSYGIWINGQVDGYTLRDSELSPVSEDNPW